MLCCRVLAASVGIASACFLAAWAQPDPKSKTPAPAPTVPAEPDQAAMEAAWTEFMTPGDHHAFIAKFEGTWNAAAKFWMAPGQPPMDSNGTMINEMVMGGRYLRSSYKADMMGMPFEGVGYWGYNNKTAKFQSTWIDSMGTGLMVLEGTCNADGTHFELRGEVDDPMVKDKVKQKETMAWVNDTTHVMTMYTINPDGTEVKTMEITYTKAAAGNPEKAKPATAPHGS
jgi:hypothetical protein